DVECGDVGAVVDLVKAIAVEHRRREPALPAFDRPLRLALLDLALGRSVDGNYLAHLARIEIFFTVRQDRGGSMDDNARVESAFADFDSPDWLARLRFDRVNETIAPALNQQARAVDVGDDWRCVGRIVRTLSGSAYPHGLARLLIE